MNTARASQSAHPFAPGAIEHHRRALATPAQWRALGLWASRVALLLATVATAAFTAGYLNA